MSKPSNSYQKTQIISYNQVFASEVISDVVPNSVQHNVPAWTIFGIFFIVITVVNNILKEKKEGSVFRLNTMPTSYGLIIMGKVLVFVALTVVQFFAMMLIGVYLMPLLGMPALNLAGNLTGLTILAIGTGFAATGFGILVGTLAQTEQQGAILGSLGVVLLSALGGVWVPTYVMPEIMRQISSFSPLNWSLDGFYKLLLRGEGISGVVMPLVKLMLFFLFTMLVALLYKHKRRTT